jgi:hypothetical protein
MLDMGYNEGYFLQRTAGQSNGCAIFWKRSMFKEVDSLDIFLDQQDIWNRPELKPNVAQLVCLQHLNFSERFVVLGNTDLISYHNRHDLRLYHTSIIAGAMERMLERWETPFGVICGDFNDSCRSFLYHYMVGDNKAYFKNSEGRKVYPQSLKFPWVSGYYLVEEENLPTSFTVLPEESDHIFFCSRAMILMGALSLKIYAEDSTLFSPSNHIPLFLKLAFRKPAEKPKSTPQEAENVESNEASSIPLQPFEPSGENQEESESSSSSTSSH